MPDPSVELLYETPKTGRLVTDESGKASHQFDTPMVESRPSLSGPTPRFGIGGSALRHSPAQSAQQAQIQKGLTPAQMLAIADSMEEQLADRIRKDEGPSLRRLAGGTRSTGYNTELTSGAEKAFQRQRDDDTGVDYDLRGRFADEGRSWAPGEHGPDTWKKPNHPTFSDESVYAGEGNPGTWGPLNKDGTDNYIPGANRGAEPVPGTQSAVGDVPDWLTQYMEKQPFTDPYHQVGPAGRAEIIKKNKYLTQKQQRDYIKFLKAGKD